MHAQVCQIAKEGETSLSKGGERDRAAARDPKTESFKINKQQPREILWKKLPRDTTRKGRISGKRGNRGLRGY